MLPAGIDAPALARAATRASLGAWLGEDEEAAAVTLVSELVANAVLHGGARSGDPVGLRLEVSEERLRVEVSDTGPGFAATAPGDPGDEATTGFGLVLVDRVATRWGVERDGGVNVWFELDR